MKHKLWNQVVFGPRQTHTNVDFTPKLDHVYFGKDRQAVPVNSVMHEAGKVGP